MGALERALLAGVDGEVRFDGGSRAAHSTDASSYRKVPVGVVVPRTMEAAAAATLACGENRITRRCSPGEAGRVWQYSARMRRSSSIFPSTAPA